MPAFPRWSVGSLTVAGKIAFPHLRELQVADGLTVASGGRLTLQGGAQLGHAACIQVIGQQLSQRIAGRQVGGAAHGVALVEGRQRRLGLPQL